MWPLDERWESWRLATRDSEGSLFVTEAGDGEPVIVLHGGPGGGLATILGLVDGLDSQLRVVLYDQRGSFLSPAKRATLSFEACLDDLSTLVEELGAPTVHLVGFSFGALVVGAFVGREPHRVGNVVLVSPAGMRRSVDGTDKEIEDRQLAARAAIERDPAWEGVLHAFGLPVDPALLGARARAEWSQVRDAWLFTRHPERYRQVRTGVFFNRDAGMAIWATMPHTWDFIEPLQQHWSKATLIVGDHDLVDPGAMLAQRWCAEGNLTCRVIPDAGHLCWVDEPRLVRSTLLNALGVH